MEKATSLAALYGLRRASPSFGEFTSFEELFRFFYDRWFHFTPLLNNGGNESRSR